MTANIHTEISAALDIEWRGQVTGDQCLASCFAVTELAAAAIGSVGGAIATLVEALGFAAAPPDVIVDQRLASLWFAWSIHPVDWQMPPAWDAIAGDYEARDGWIKLHTNLPHHRKAALAALKCDATRDDVAAAVQRWHAEPLETAIVEAGGCAAAMRTSEAWRAHPQGKAVASEPLIAWTPARQDRIRSWPGARNQPLAGLRVLDLTRVLAGPVATRTLAGFGAEVLRVDPTGWDEAVVVPDITLGKRCCRLDLHRTEDRVVFEALLSKADILVHGYRHGALERLGYGEIERHRLAPNLIEVTLNAYGWTGPWAERRGFDSLVQMSCGIADAGMRRAKRDAPTPLPVQALDHATGYLMAAAAIRALAAAITGKGVRNVRLSLARTAELLKAHRQPEAGGLSLKPDQSDFSPQIEHTPWGAAHRLKPPLDVAGAAMQWRLPACELGSAPAEWP